MSMALSFSDALTNIKNGVRMQREGWNGKGMYVELQRPDQGSKMTLPYIFMRTAQGDLVPWLASQTDILAVDWTTARFDAAASGEPAIVEAGTAAPSVVEA